MNRKFVLAAAAYLLFAPALFADMPREGGMGATGARSDLGQPGSGNGGSQQKGPAEPAPVPAPPTADNVDDILTFKDKLGLTGQQAVSIQLIGADARRELAGKLAVVQEYRQSLAKGLNEHNPDFADIRTRLDRLAEAQANANAVPVDAYEKAYMLLTEDQKAKLSFFRAVRRQEREKKAAAAAQEATQPPPPSRNTLPSLTGY